MRTEQEMNTSSDSPLPTTFSSLPYDLVLYCLARVSTLCRPTLSLVSKHFRSLMASPELEATGFRMGRSLMASPELEATRTRMGITETYLCVCLDLNKHYSSSHWFTLAPIPKQEKLQHNVSFPMLYPEYSTVISIGSEIYIIGGTESNSIEDWGEVYDPKTQTWEPVLPTTLDLTKQMSVVPGKLVMGGKVYAMKDGYNLRLMKDFCLVEIDNMLYQTRVSKGILRWSDPKKNLRSTRVKGLERLPKCTHLTLSAYSD
ncbi:hypothetical protein ARALYDRAFT_892155 [Arabidopsis lyrata subsp. lyrata]|uniref:F-box domain-containing protein n=1 Tax=Arabidopsis lyrata subsp. lyrata TaxID=81972 RepID=D7KIJ5_ARALL|nr:hypothetical protein ARALYDRAFT_892155 [Arabidopsis lyrata subsp. lyrata]